MPSGVPIGDADRRHDQTAGDRVQEAAGAARGRGHLREDGERQPSESLPEKHGEDQEQPSQAEGGGRDAEAHAKRSFGDAARGKRTWRYIPALMSSRISMSRAIARTMKVIMNRIRPSAISDEV